MPFFLYGVYQAIKEGPCPLRRLVYLLIWTIMMYSLAAHKEWRFIHPLLPVMHVIASKPITDSSFARLGKLSKLWTRYRRLWILLTVIMAPFLLFVQSRAQIAVMHYLRTIPDDELRSLGFLTPCHSTPWQAYLHRPHLKEGLLWAIGCEPPLGDQDLETYKDQSDIFYESPLAYLRARFPSTVDHTFPPSPFPTSLPGAIDAIDEQWKHTWPSHLVFFGALLDHEGVGALLEERGYQETWSAWNGWEQDPRRKAGIKVWSLNSK
ncbi:hypothetical protein Clacol_006812 [Clathrus columnatus]|uniref:Mannosyltransferase n=1 Tax=Clathrus columnatus TaxID=1419009 RepID=A0AAV5AD49_9AGAM|nr:hypothetical protein Clacol_006812 [Clathrus columnatus]